MSNLSAKIQNLQQKQKNNYGEETNYDYYDCNALEMNANIANGEKQVINYINNNNLKTPYHEISNHQRQSLRLKNPSQGIRNVGNTCCISSIIQMLYASQTLKNKFIQVFKTVDNQIVNNQIVNKPFIAAIGSLFKSIKQEESQQARATRLSQLVYDLKGISEDYKQFAQQDASSLFLNLLAQFRKEDQSFIESIFNVNFSEFCSQKCQPAQLQACYIAINNLGACQKCSQKRSVLIKSQPEYLLVINNGSDQIKDVLTLKTEKSTNQGQVLFYSLISNVVYSGYGKGGHYKSYRKVDKGKWKQFDDAFEKVVGIKKVVAGKKNHIQNNSFFNLKLPSIFSCTSQKKAWKEQQYPSSYGSILSFYKKSDATCLNQYDNEDPQIYFDPYAYSKKQQKVGWSKKFEKDRKQAQESQKKHQMAKNIQKSNQELKKKLNQSLKSQLKLMANQIYSAQVPVVFTKRYEQILLGSRKVYFKICQKNCTIKILNRQQFFYLEDGQIKMNSFKIQKVYQLIKNRILQNGKKFLNDPEIKSPKAFIQLDNTTYMGNQFIPQESCVSLHKDQWKQQKDFQQNNSSFRGQQTSMGESYLSEKIQDIDEKQMCNQPVIQKKYRMKINVFVNQKQTKLIQRSQIQSSQTRKIVFSILEKKISQKNQETDQFEIKIWNHQNFFYVDPKHPIYRFTGNLKKILDFKYKLETKLWQQARTAYFSDKTQFMRKDKESSQILVPQYGIF